MIKSRDASVILIPTLVDKSPDPLNEQIQIIFYTKAVADPKRGGGDVRPPPPS